MNSVGLLTGDGCIIDVIYPTCHFFFEPATGSNDLSIASLKADGCAVQLSYQ